ncbi:MAG: tautomerase family protein [Nitrospinota bacterium]|jgi:4-oxalocrotonate tautomerase|nr:tautomerase family protein [Nitrospinota bacterium]MDP6367278.1 tautomerase family protein [Nitrospinota bacterium]|tara:strand:+ start:878 stop:1099 length:222 start_codon:yes stop_codon:yes gene_type:complete
MPTIVVNLTEGRTDDQKREIIKEITNIFVRQGVPSKGVTVILNEMSEMHYGIDGEAVADKFKSPEDVAAYFGT